MYLQHAGHARIHECETARLRGQEYDLRRARTEGVRRVKEVDEREGTLGSVRTRALGFRRVMETDEREGTLGLVRARKMGVRRVKERDDREEH